MLRFSDRQLIIAAAALQARAAVRLRSERGQTAAEYLGVIVVVAAIIAALSQTNIGETIGNGITDTIDRIAGN